MTKYDPEYWGLALLCTDEQAEIALKMGVRQPKTLDQMVKVTGKDRGYLEKQLEEMAEVALVEYNWENPQHEKQYVLPIFVPGSAEFSCMNAKMLEKHPELGIFFERMSRIALEGLAPFMPEGGVGMHVIPVEKAISTENQSLPIEHISHWLEKYEGKYAASPCSCRRSRKTFDEGCADDPEEWCIAVGDMADYIVETNKGGHYITKERALEILKQAEDNGFVHQITNIDGENKIFAICNCNVNVCYALRTSQLFNTPNMDRSAYVAKVETENCVACGRCVEYCPAGAVKLGQKLCKKDGSQVEYPKHVLPTEKKWGPEMWDEDYRDKNRINCYDTGTAPCKTACPAHIAVQGYIKMAAQGRYRDALALIKKNNPLPAVCGHICNRRCEDACTRGTIDQAITIDEVKKFIAAQELNAETRFIPEKVVPATKGYFDEKIAIIGGGPAGLSCAFYLAEKGYKPTIFEKNERAGGMLVYGIPSFKLEKDVVQAEIDIIKEMGVEIKTGIEDSDMANLFTKFHKGNHKERGSGFGLYYAKTIMEMHGGLIRAYNNTNKGATFYLELPLLNTNKKEESAHLQQKDSPLPSSIQDTHFDCTGKTVLIVEDEKELREYLISSLTEFFKKVYAADNAVSALEICQKKQPSIIISDVMMPQMDGFELCRQIKNNIQISHIPVILLTARYDQTGITTGYKSGADAYIPKPFDLDSLKIVIGNILKNREKIHNQYISINQSTSLQTLTNSKADEDFMTKINIIIHENLSDEEFSVQQLADLMTISRSSLYNKIKIITGLGVNDYINRLRIEKAISLLTNTNLNINEISSEVGFTYPRYFSSTFKQMKGMTPKQFREENRMK